MSLSALDRLQLFLKPPGRGLLTFSTGGGYAASVLDFMYGAHDTRRVHAAWQESLQGVRQASTVIMGIPSDCGAGIMRGANFGPIGVREAYFEKYGKFAKGVLDLGDVACVPNLLHDEMLGNTQIEKTGKELYGEKWEGLPVSPLSIAEHALYAIHELNPTAKVILIGGDHSCSWPAMKWCHHVYGDDFGVLHFDAHSDLMQERTGVRYCFATWAYHGMRLVKPHYFVQVGIRVSANTKETWMRKYPVIQHWTRDILGNESETIAEILQHYREKGVKRVYITNDVDGTDPSFAPATGTPEANGLTPDFVKELIACVKGEFEVFGGDVVEVAPPLSGIREYKNEKTCVLGADYLQALM